jgi:hypothetical protein
MKITAAKPKRCFGVPLKADEKLEIIQPDCRQAGPKESL